MSSILSYIVALCHIYSADNVASTSSIHEKQLEIVQVIHAGSIFSIQSCSRTIIQRKKNLIGPLLKKNPLI